MSIRLGGTMVSPLVNNGGGSGDVINGIIEDYKAFSETVSANTFVEFVSDIGISQVAQITANRERTSHVYPIVLSSNKVVVIYGTTYGTSVSWTGYVYGVVCTISNNTITAGTEIKLCDKSSSGQYVSATKIASDKIFVTYYDKDAEKNYAMVCTVSGDSITAGTSVAIPSSSSISLRYCVTYSTTIDTNKVFVAYTDGQANNLFAVVCTISGTTITIGAETTIISGNCSQLWEPLLLGTNKVGLVYLDDPEMFGIVCSISGSTITTGAETLLATDAIPVWSCRQTAISMSADSFILFNWGSTSYALRFLFCTVSGTTITPGNNVPVFGAADYGSFDDAPSSFVQLAPDKLFGVFSADYAHGFYGIVFTVSGSNVSHGAPKELPVMCQYSGELIPPVMCSSNEVFYFHEGNSGTDIPNAILCYGSFEDKVATSTYEIKGLTKTACTTSTAGQVWVLDD